MIKEMHISGFRGFGVPQVVPFAIPNGEDFGSGLTIITGANNSGKTTIIESIRAFNGKESPSFSEGRRNKQAKEIVELKLVSDTESISSIKSVPGGGSSTEKTGSLANKIYVLQSRRAIPFEFGKTQWDREQFIMYSQNLSNQRDSSLSSFEARIFEIEKNKPAFDAVIQQILGEDFQWTVDQRDSGQYYLKYTKDDVTHSSEGVGDGIWSIFTICAALFDAPENSTVVIDEPELSIHPALQKKLMRLFGEYSKTRQIVISTHSPYFIDWSAIINGAMLIRAVKDGTSTKCFYMTEESRRLFAGILNDLNNPHTLGIEANEVFFLNDKIILVEGQEDVVIFNKIANTLGISLQEYFFGWGVGGAPKMKAFLQLFRDMGYKKVVAILDGDKKDVADELDKDYAEIGYIFFTLPTDDIRDKKERTTASKCGIASEKGVLKEEYKSAIEELFCKISDFFRS